MSYGPTKLAPRSLDVARRTVLPAPRQTAYRLPLVSWKRSLQLSQLAVSPFATRVGAPNALPVNFRPSHVVGKDWAPWPVVMAYTPPGPPASARDSPCPTVVGPLQLAA